MGKFSSIVLGAAAGAAAAIFLSSEKGKEVRARVSNFIKEVQENPDEFKEQVCHSATDLKNQTVDTVTQVRDKVNNGEITISLLVVMHIMYYNNLSLQIQLFSLTCMHILQKRWKK